MGKCNRRTGDGWIEWAEINCTGQISDINDSCVTNDAHTTLYQFAISRFRGEVVGYAAYKNSSANLR